MSRMQKLAFALAISLCFAGVGCKEVAVTTQKKAVRQQISLNGKAIPKTGLAGLPNPATFAFMPDPFVFTAPDGTQLYKFDTQRFTILENGASTQYTLNWNATSLGWTAFSQFGDGPPDIFIEIQDAKQGDLDSWDVGRQMLPCGVQGNPMVFTNNNGKPNILETNTSSIGVVLSFRAPADFKRC